MEKVSSSSNGSNGSNGGGSSNLGLEMTSRSTSSRSTSSRSMSSRKLGFEFENPFALKMGQVFTGFGIGCGVGIGVGSPLNLAALPIPGLQQVMSATRGATDAFSGVGRHVNNSLKRFGGKNIQFGGKNIQAGIGCGVGFGHGFGAGLAIKPGVVQRLQSCIAETMLKMMLKFGTVPGLSVGQNMLKGPLQSGMSMMTETSMQNPMGNLMQLTTKTLEQTSQDQTKDGTLDIGSLYKTSASKVTTLGTSVGSSRTEKVISNFLQNPAFKDDEDMQRNESAGRLRSESNVLQMVLKHQQAIEELMDENEKLRRILIEELKVPPNKLQASTSHGTKSITPCSDCFECRRKQRKHR